MAELLEKIIGVFRQAYWVARQHPKYKETLDISKLTLTQANRVLDDVKEALPELAKAAGYVQLDDDQSLDEIKSRYTYDELATFTEIARYYGWRKVILR